MSLPLVSIITPCYNCEKTIERLMDSILNQTYDNIEFILVNDGSTDKTESIAKGYEDKFLKRGYKFIYFYQENKGLGGAINSGLKLFTGDYLCWPDHDDYLEPTSIEDRLNVLEENPEYAVVTSNAYVRQEDGSVDLLVKETTEITIDENQFEHMLKGDSIFCPGCHMVRVSDFLKVNPNREIFPYRRGQNWQMLLPLYYKFKRYFLNKPLYNYMVYKGSMSRTDKGFEDIYLRFCEHQDIILKTLEMIENIQNENLQSYKKGVTARYCTFKLRLALKYNENEAFDKEFKMKKQFGLTSRDIVYYILRHIKFLRKFAVK